MDYNTAKDLLFEGAEIGDLIKVKEALIIIKDVNIINDIHYKRTPLDYASSNGHLEVVEYLITLGAEVNTKYGRTPLIWASLNGHLKVVKYLISKGAFVNIKDIYGYTSLHWASINTHLDIVKYLISKGGDVNSQNDDKWTSLHEVSRNGNLEIVKFLISNGAEVNIKNNDKWTPLQFASHNDNLEVVKYLLFKCADPKLETKKTIAKIKKFLKPTREKIYRIYHLSRFLHQKYPGVEVISGVLRLLLDPNEKFFSDEELMAIATFGTQNRPKVLLETEEQKYQHLYTPLSEEYPHLFGYLRILI